MQNTYGQMKFNPCGNKVALTIGYDDKWELFDFNTNTGMVSSPKTFYQTAHVYGIEFSAESSKIYLSTYDVNKTLVQYDISLTPTLAIAASETTISATPSIYGLQLANDGKIYVCKSFSQYVGVVNSPSVAGVACNYNDTQVDVDPSFMGVTAALSLPGFPQNYFLPTGFVCPAVTTTGIKEISVQHDMPLIYPNPSANNFSVQTKGPSKIEVYSSNGKLIEVLTSEKNETLTFGENYAKGIYFVNTLDGGKTAGIKIIKQ
jgi:hypothetical protein